MRERTRQGVLIGSDRPDPAALAGPRMLKDTTSEEFAWQSARWLKTVYQSKEISEQQWRNALAEVDRYRIYDRIPPGHPYGSLDALLEAEIGTNARGSIADVQRRAHGTQPLTKHGGVGRGRNRVSDTNSKKVDADYLTARIARDHPDILERMKAGEYASVRQAALEAGILKARVSVNADRYATLQGLATQLAEFLCAMNADNDAWVFEVMYARMAEMLQALGHEVPPGILERLKEV